MLRISIALVLPVLVLVLARLVAQPLMGMSSRSNTHGRPDTHAEAAALRTSITEDEVARLRIKEQQHEASGRKLACTLRAAARHPDS